MTMNPNDERDEAETLLPWYAKGALDAVNRQRVEDALSRWPELRESLRLVQEDRDETIALNEGLGAPGPEAWARIISATRAEPRRPTTSARLASLARIFGLGAETNPTRLAWIGAAAAVVIIIQGAAIITLAPSRSGAAYQTATTKSKEGAELLITFAPDARIGDISAFLKERHGSIDEGPRSNWYSVRFGNRRLSTEETNALVEELRASPIVQSVQPGGRE